MRTVSIGLLVQTAILAIHAKISDVHFTANNYSLCVDKSLIQVKWAQRHYDPINNLYSFVVLALPSRNVSDVNQNRTFYSTAKTEIQYGLQKTTSYLDKFCIDVAEGCPIMQGNWTLLQKSVQLAPNRLPLADITTRYSAWTGDREPIICLTLATVGHQDPFWRDVFRYFSVAVAVFAALTTLIVSYAVLPIDDYFDEFQWLMSSSPVAYASQLRLPGLHQVIYYTQFIVLTGQMTVSYPKFYRLFTSDFAWSFLLTSTNWINHGVIQKFFPQNNTNENSIGSFPTYSIPGQSLNKRDELQYNVSYQITNVTGTGMAKFADAIDIDVNGIFYTCLVYFLLLLCLCAIIGIILFMLNQLLYCLLPFRREKNTRKVINFTIGLFLQCVTICYLPLIVTSFYQLMLPAPWFFLLAAAILVVFPLFLLYGCIIFVLLRLGEVAPLLRQSSTFARIGSLYDNLGEGYALFYIVPIIDMIVKGIMIGLIQTSGAAQVIVLILSETVHCGLLVVLQPYVTRATNHFHVLLGSFRLLHLILMITYLDSLSISERTKQYVAYTQVCLHIFVFVMLFLFFAVKHLLVVLTGTSDDVFYDPTTAPVRMSRWWWRLYHREGSSFQPVDTTTTIRPPCPPPHREIPHHLRRPETERLLSDQNLFSSSKIN